VKTFKVSFRPRAQADLFQIYEYIAASSGHDIAIGYVDRIEAACKALEIFPQRGTQRDDIYPGLRTIGFERRATIVFRVKRTEVVIIRIFYGGQDFENVLRGHRD
jgi:toxin ParE1/3/4